MIDRRVGLEREGVLGPALLEVEHGVAAHAAVGEVELTFREACAVAGRDDERVPMTEDVVRVGRAAAVPVGDGVTLEEDALIRREGRDRFHRYQ
jgi:hypothetical protein